ncbi:DUF4352 domain-containing protein [Niallia circulans]|uniref:DUF4352 domain-containing protein n=1 Tax=Niallia circulans TaxID=1397 RepID=UPI0002F7F687
MKQIMIYLFIFLLLAGCSSKETNTSTNKHNLKKEAMSTETDDIRTVSTDIYAPNPQVIDDATLLTAGDFYRDRKGEATLKAIMKEAKNVQVDSIRLTIKDVKLIDYRPAYSLIDFYHTYTHDEQFTFIKFFVEIENLSDERKKFSPVAFIQTNKDEMITWEKDIYLEELNGVLKPGERKKGNIGFIVKDSAINKVQLTTSDAYTEQDKILGDAKTIDFHFK